MPDTSIYGTADYRRSRVAYNLECAFEYLISLLVTDSFLALLLSSLGISDSLVGIISSIISLAFLFEFLSVFVVQKITNTKRFILIFHTASEVFFLGLYLIPFIPAFAEFRAAAAVVCILIAYFGNYFVTTIIFKWSNSYVDPHKRGEFSSVKEMISLLSGIVVTVATGYIMEVFCDAGNKEGWFALAAVSIFVFSVCDFTCLMLIKNNIKPKAEKKAQTVPQRTVFRETLGKKYFLNTVILDSLWRIAFFTTVGFLGTYKNFLFAVSTVQIINAVANLVRFAFSRPIGRYSDKHSYAAGIKLGFTIAACAFAVNIFTTPDTRWLLIVYMVLYSVSIAGIEQNMMNISYNFVDSHYFVQAMAIKSSIAGLAGFGASVLAGQLLAYIQNNGNMLFGIHVYGQQVLSLITLVILIIAIFFTKFVIEKQKIMIQ